MNEGETATAWLLSFPTVVGDCRLLPYLPPLPAPYLAPNSIETIDAESLSRDACEAMVLQNTLFGRLCKGTFLLAVITAYARGPAPCKENGFLMTKNKQFAKN